MPGKGEKKRSITLRNQARYCVGWSENRPVYSHNICKVRVGRTQSTQIIARLKRHLAKIAIDARVIKIVTQTLKEFLNLLRARACGREGIVINFQEQNRLGGRQKTLHTPYDERLRPFNVYFNE